MGAVGVLALQGAYDAHTRALGRAGFAPRLVRRAEELDGVDGLVLPGGESTTQLSLLHALGLEPALTRFAASGRPVLATCAGLVLCAREVRGPAQRSLGLLDVTVVRNGWGRQRDSFEGTSARGAVVVAIRAPRIVAVSGATVVEDSLDAEPIRVRRGNVVGLTYHPELTEDVSTFVDVFGEPAARRSRASP